MKKARIGIRLKTTLMILVLGVALGALLIGMTSQILSRVVQKDYEDKAWAITTNAAQVVNGDAYQSLTQKMLDVLHSIPTEKWVGSWEWGTPEFEEYLSNFTFLEDDPEYKELFEQLTNLLEINEVEDIYLNVFDNKYQMVALYLIDPATGEDHCPIGTFDHVYGNNVILFEQPEVGLTPYTTNTEEYGWLVSAGVPVYASDGSIPGYITADISMNNIKTQINDFLLQLVAAVIAITVAVILIYLFIIDRVVIRPVKKLAQAANTYLSDESGASGSAETESHSFRDLPIKSRDEIGDLYAAVRQMEENLNDHIHKVVSLAKEQERLGAELNVATQIQESMVPTDFAEASRQNIELFGSMVPAKEVGGDFYDYIWIDKDHLGLVMADVSGKGVGAALFMAITKTFLQSRTLMGGTPEEILNDTNRWLCSSNRAGFFVTVWLGILTVSSGELKYANAGHEYPVMIGKDGASIVQMENDPPLGADEDVAYGSGSFTLSTGSRLLLYTDGVPEAKNGAGERYGMERMQKAVDGNASSEETIRKLKEDLSGFVGETEAFDDVTLLCVGRN